MTNLFHKRPDAVELSKVLLHKGQPLSLVRPEGEVKQIRSLIDGQRGLLIEKGVVRQ